MTRTTRTDIIRRTERLADLTGVPLRLTMWSPCDGYTRYQVEDGHRQPITDRVYRLHEMAAFLDGAILAAESRKWSIIGRQDTEA